ncbi:MAG: hypothetical protein HOI95_19220 [Chromatiales bacterium]|nr:hypothetical protein [Chromatiales bacterium]
MVRLGLSVEPQLYGRGWHATGVLGVFGACGAACKLLGLSMHSCPSRSLPARPPACASFSAPHRAASTRARLQWPACSRACGPGRGWKTAPTSSAGLMACGCSRASCATSQSWRAWASASR